MDTLTTLRDEIRLVVANLEQREWIQGAMQRGDGVCAHGAVKTCEGLRPGDEYVIRAVMRAKGMDESWNDEDGRTKAEVLERMAHLVGVSDADLADMFGPNWRQVIAVTRRVAMLTFDEVQRLQAAWDAARGAAWDAAWDAARVAALGAVRVAARVAARAAARDAAGDAAWVAEWDAAWAAAWDTARVAVVADLVGQHGLEQHHIDTLMKPWIDTLGPDWSEGLA